MPFRALKKLYPEDYCNKLPTPNESESEEDVPISKGFGLLNIEENVILSNNESEEGSSNDEAAVIQVKSYKKNNRRKKKAKGNMKDSFDDLPGPSSSPLTTVVLKEEPNYFDALFTINPHYLNAEHEFQKICGSKKLKLERVKIKSYRLIERKGDRLATEKAGLTLVETSKENNEIHLRLCMSQDKKDIYNLIELLEGVNYSVIQEIMNNNMTMPPAILLMQICHTMEENEDYESARRLVEATLFVMENAIREKYLFKGNRLRFDYKYLFNRLLLVTMLKYTVMISKTMCHRTAFEVGRLAYTLEPKDPYAFMLMMDHLALRAEKYQWLCQLFETRKDLEKWPNFLYSYALAQFHLKLEDKATASLTLALSKHPYMLPKILAQCPRYQELKELIRTNEVFEEAKKLVSPYLDGLYNLYALRSHMLWLEDKVEKWLADSVKKIITMLPHEVKMRNISVRFLEPTRCVYRHAIVLHLMKEMNLYEENLMRALGSMNSVDPLPPYPTSPVEVLGIEPEQEPENAISRQRLLSGLQVFVQSINPSFSVE